MATMKPDTMSSNSDAVITVREPVDALRGHTAPSVVDTPASTSKHYQIGGEQQPVDRRNQLTSVRIDPRVVRCDPTAVGPIHKVDTAGPVHKVDTAGPIHKVDTAGPIHKFDTAGPIHKVDTIVAHRDNPLASKGRQLLTTFPKCDPNLTRSDPLVTRTDPAVTVTITVSSGHSSEDEDRETLKNRNAQSRSSLPPRNHCGRHVSGDGGHDQLHRPPQSFPTIYRSDTKNSEPILTDARILADIGNDASLYGHGATHVTSCGNMTSPLHEQQAKTYNGSSTTTFLKDQIVSFFQVSDNKLAMKLFGNKNALLKEKLRQKSSGHWVIHPCSNFRSVEKIYTQ